MFHRSIIRVIRIFGNSGSVPNPTRISGDSHIAASQVNEFTPIGSARVSSPSGHVRVRAGSREYVAACGRGAGAAQRGMVGGGRGGCARKYNKKRNAKAADAPERNNAGAAREHRKFRRGLYSAREGGAIERST